MSISVPFILTMNAGGNITTFLNTVEANAFVPMPMAWNNYDDRTPNAIKGRNEHDMRMNNAISS